MTFFTRRASFAAAAGLVAATASSLTANEASAQPNDGDVAGPRVIETPGLAVPVRRDNDLIGYVFVGIRTVLTANVDVWVTRERNHFLRDAYVRACFRQRLVDPTRPTEMLQPLADNSFRAAAAEVLGARAVQSVAVIRAQALGSRFPG